MGCDIHCYIEYKKYPAGCWKSFGGSINPGRDYDLFARLAGVRNYNGITPIVSPRGFPEDAGYYASGDNWLYVMEEAREGCCNQSQAEMYVSQVSRWRDDEKRFVSNPEFHSHSWLTPDEYAEAIKDSLNAEYQAILKAMRSFKADGYEARIVFWFDN